jgi:protein-tyrosine phosphatase
MARRGYTSAHVARQFDRAWFAERDVILALDAQNAADLRLLAPDPASRAKVRMLGAYAAGNGPLDPRESGDDEAVAVPDPYGGTDDDFDRALALIEAACAGFVRHLLEVGPEALRDRPAHPGRW